MAHQNIRDRFYGQEDPVAAKMLAKQDEIPTLTPPQDEGITSLWLGNMSPEITQEVNLFSSLFFLVSARRVSKRTTSCPWFIHTQLGICF